MTERVRFRSAVVAAALAALLLSACEGDSAEDGAELDEDHYGSGAMENFEAGDTFVATEPLSFSLLYRDHPNYPLQEDWLILQHLEQEHGVSLDPVVAPLSDYEDRRGVLIGSGQTPDFMPVIWPGHEDPFIAGGSLLPVSDYLDYMPNFTEKLDKWNLWEEFDNLRKEDGKAYILPGLREDPYHQWTIAIRDDIWQEQGLEDPETWDEFREQLELIQDEYPDMIPWSDRWQMNATLNLVSPSFNTTGGWGYGDGLRYNHAAEEFIYIGASDEYREMLEYFASLVGAGLLDPESLTQDDEVATQKFTSGQSAAISTNEEEMQGYREAIREAGSEAEVRMIPVPAGPVGNVVEGGGRFDVGLVIASAAANREDFLALLQFIDWLYYSDSGLEFATWGVEGETYQVGADAERQLLEHVGIKDFHPGAETHLSVDYGFYNGVFTHNFGSDTELFLSLMSEEVVELQEQMADKEELPLQPNIPFTDLELEQVSLWQTALTDYVNQATAQFIIGQRSFEDWDVYVAELESRGMFELLEAAEDAHQRGQEMLEELEE